jgi:hypothetical protein
VLANVPTLAVTADLDLFLQENLEPAIRLGLRPGQGGADLRPYVFVRVVTDVEPFCTALGIPGRVL